MSSGEKPYIWQADDWPNWRYDLPALASSLTEVSRAQGVLLGGLGTCLVAALWWRLFPTLAERDALATAEAAKVSTR